MPHPNYMNYQTEIDWCASRSASVLKLMSVGQVHADCACGVAHADPHALSHAARDALDRRQHHRPLPLRPRRLACQTPACRHHRHLPRRQVRGNHGAVVRCHFKPSFGVDGVPRVEEFVLLADNAFSREEIIKGERIMLGSLHFNISPYCTPYTWLRRISKADDYDIQTRFVA
jgi:hypothetical protein